MKKCQSSEEKPKCEEEGVWTEGTILKCSNLSFEDNIYEVGLCMYMHICVCMYIYICMYNAHTKHAYT